MMYAKFSPQGDRVAFVRKGDIYVERLADGAITRLTTGADSLHVNGMSDWVYEEEFGVRDGFRWSPDGDPDRLLPFRHDRRRHLPDDQQHRLPLPLHHPDPVPEGRHHQLRRHRGRGERQRRRHDLAPAPRRPARGLHPVHGVGGRGLGAGAADEPAAEQRRAASWPAPPPAACAPSSPRRTRPGSTCRTTSPGSRATRNSSGSASGTAGATSMPSTAPPGRRGSSRRAPSTSNSIAAVDEKGGWLYYTASPDNATQHYLWRTRLDGKGTGVRLTPADQAGGNRYTVSPDAKWAFHSWSTFDTPAGDRAGEPPQAHGGAYAGRQHRAGRQGEGGPHAGRVLPGAPSPTAPRSTAG